VLTKLSNRDIVDSERWTGNVLKILRGPLNRALYSSADVGISGGHGSSIAESSASPSVLGQ